MLNKVRLWAGIDNQRREIHAQVGQSLRDEVTRAGLSPGGTCDGAMICCSCHVLLSGCWADALLPSSEEEADVLHALRYEAGQYETEPELRCFDLETDTGFPGSGLRLSCQILVQKSHHNLYFKIPACPPCI